jgi:hypothetical protein
MVFEVPIPSTTGRDTASIINAGNWTFAGTGSVDVPLPFHHLGPGVVTVAGTVVLYPRLPRADMGSRVLLAGEVVVTPGSRLTIRVPVDPWTTGEAWSAFLGHGALVGPASAPPGATSAVVLLGSVHVGCSGALARWGPGTSLTLGPGTTLAAARFAQLECAAGSEWTLGELATLRVHSGVFTVKGTLTAGSGVALVGGSWLGHWSALVGEGVPSGLEAPPSVHIASGGRVTLAGYPVDGWPSVSSLALGVDVEGVLVFRGPGRVVVEDGVLLSATTTAGPGPGPVVEVGLGVVVLPRARLTSSGAMVPAPSPNSTSAVGLRVGSTASLLYHCGSRSDVVTLGLGLSVVEGGVVGVHPLSPAPTCTLVAPSVPPAPAIPSAATCAIGLCVEEAGGSAGCVGDPANGCGGAVNVTTLACPLAGQGVCATPEVWTWIGAGAGAGAWTAPSPPSNASSSPTNATSWRQGTVPGPAAHLELVGECALGLTAPLVAASLLVPPGGSATLGPGVTGPATGPIHLALLHGGVVASGGTLRVHGVRLVLLGPFAVEGTLILSGGAVLEGPGALTASEGGLVVVHLGPGQSGQVTVRGVGVRVGRGASLVTVGSGTLALVSPGAALVVDPGGSLLINGTAARVTGAGGGRLEVAGLVTLDGGVEVAAPLAVGRGGHVVLSATAAVLLSATSRFADGGALTVPSGAVVAFSGTSHGFDVGSSLAARGTIVVYGCETEVRVGGFGWVGSLSVALGRLVVDQRVTAPGARALPVAVLSVGEWTGPGRAPWAISGTPLGLVGCPAGTVAAGTLWAATDVNVERVLK